MGDDGLAQIILGATGLGIAVADIGGGITRTNPALQRMLGRTAEALGGWQLHELTHPDDADTGRALLRELVDGARESYRVERRHGAVWMQVTVSIWRGEPAVVVGIAEDVTARREAREALIERRKELTALHGAARILLDRERADDDALHAIARLVPPAMVYPELATAAVRHGDRVFATPGHAETPWMLSAPFSTLDGVRGEIAVAYHEDRADPGTSAFLAEESAVLASLAGMLRSALDRDLASASERETNDHLNLALTAAGMAVWEWDLEKNEVRWSKQLGEMTGLGGVAVGPMGWREEVVHPDDRDGLRATLLQVAERGDALAATEARIRRPDGTWRQMLVSARAVDGDGRRVIAALVDISQRHALEEGLRQAQKLEALGQIAAGVAHDFNNLLSVILGSVELLRVDLPAEHPLAELVIDAQTAVKSATQLTRQLLMFSRKGEFKPAAVNLTALTMQLEPMLVRLATRRNKLTVVVGRLCTVWADPTQLEQVLINLVVNARDAMPDGGTIAVSTDVIDGQVMLAVRDSGPGVPAELRTRIFEPFFTTKEPGKGTGLGLATVASVARQWRGRVELASAPGQGAEFRLWLPLLSR